jgi:hypothetical protein
MNDLARTVTRLGKNPIWAFAWTLLTLSVGYIVSYEYAWPDSKPAFERKHAELAAARTELDRGKEMVTLWRSAFRDLTDSARATNDRMTPETLTPSRLRETTRKGVTHFRDQRILLSRPIAAIRRFSFEEPSMQVLQTKLLSDLATADSIAERRARMFIVMLDDSLHRSPAPVLDVNVQLDELRGTLETEGREAEIERVIERARVKHNNILFEGQAMEARYKLQSRKAVVAWTYIFCFIGAVIGHQVGGRRKRQPVVAKQGSERVIFDGRERLDGFKVEGEANSLWKGSGTAAHRTSPLGEGSHEIFEGVGIDIRRTNTAGRYELMLKEFVLDGKTSPVIPRDARMSGKRKFAISCEAKASGGDHTLRFVLRDPAIGKWVTSKTRRISGNEWTRVEVFLFADPTVDLQVRIDDEDVSAAPSSVQIRNLVVVERLG